MNKIKLLYDIPGGTWYDEVVKAEDCESLYDLAVECGYTDVLLTSSFTRLANCITENLIDLKWEYTIVNEKYCDRILKVFKNDKVVTLISSKNDLVIDITKADQLIQSYVLEVAPFDNYVLEHKSKMFVDLIYKSLFDYTKRTQN